MEASQLTGHYAVTRFGHALMPSYLSILSEKTAFFRFRTQRKRLFQSCQQEVPSHDFIMIHGCLVVQKCDRRKEWQKEHYNKGVREDEIVSIMNSRCCVVRCHCECAREAVRFNSYGEGMNGSERGDLMSLLFFSSSPPSSPHHPSLTRSHLI